MCSGGAWHYTCCLVQRCKWRVSCNVLSPVCTNAALTYAGLLCTSGEFITAEILPIFLHLSKVNLVVGNFFKDDKEMEDTADNANMVAKWF